MRTLRNAIAANRIAHAYLFVGPRGIGKTSTARIFAMALNCPGGPSADFDPNDPVCREIAEGRSLDVREIDGASNNGVDQVRELRDEVRFAPQAGRYKIFIIDEVHMLSPAAFNALLKTLEEPPAHVKFILATTEVHKVLPTILSRCQRFDLKRLTTRLIADHLEWIAQQEGLEVQRSALEAVAAFADGGMRDAESALDQLIAFCGRKIEEQDVLQIFGLTPQKAIGDLAQYILQGQAGEAWRCVNALDAEGKDLARVLGDVLAHFRRLLIYQKAPDVIRADCGEEQLRALEAQASLLVPAKLLRVVERLSEAEPRFRYALSQRAQLEVVIASTCEIAREVELDEVLRWVRGMPVTSEPITRPVPPAKEESAPPAPAPAPVSVPTPAPVAAPVPVHASVAVTPTPPAAKTPPAPVEAKPAAQEKPADPLPVPVPSPAPAPATPPPSSPAPREETRPVVASAPSETPVAAKPTPPPAAPVPETAVKMDLVAAWEKVKEGLSNLIRSSLSVQCEGKTITLSAPSSTLTLARQTSGVALERNLRQLTGADIEVRWVETALPSNETASLSVTPGGPTEKGSPAPANTSGASDAPSMTLEELKNDPAVHEALEIFGARIVGYRPKETS
jgi:DNA polymerase-3 subunit gamma/tau